MKSYYVFSDECGQYIKERSQKFNNAHPFYVRSTVIIDLDDYIKLDNLINQIKNKYNISYKQEIKWSHLGNYIKGKPPEYLTDLSLSDFKNCISEIIKSINKCESLLLFFTLTDNRIDKQVDEIKLITMHLQNMLQRVCYEMKNNRFASIIIDDLGKKKNGILKRVCYSLMNDGDTYVNYQNILKSILIDFSDQCTGLQIADICAGIMTASLKYISSADNKKQNFKYSYDLLMSVIYNKIRYSKYGDIYGYGIREVPNNAGTKISKEISQLIKNKQQQYIQEDFHFI